MHICEAPGGVSRAGGGKDWGGAGFPGHTEAAQADFCPEAAAWGSAGRPTGGARERPPRARKGVGGGDPGGQRRKEIQQLDPGREAFAKPHWRPPSPPKGWGATRSRKTGVGPLEKVPEGQTSECKVTDICHGSNKWVGISC